MENYNWTKLPLYDEWDYKYVVPINNRSFEWRLFYSDRTRTWSVDVIHEEGDIIIQGDAIFALSPSLEGVLGFPGFLWLEPKSQDINETVDNPELLYKYYNLYYIWWEDE